MYDYISGIIHSERNILLAINGVADHIHLLVRMHPTNSPSNLAKVAKAKTSKWINEEILGVNRFYWQEGYGCFSYSHSQVPRVIGYIKKQKQHHAQTTFKEEYLDILKKAEIAFEEEYVFDFLD